MLNKKHIQCVKKLVEIRETNPLYKNYKYDIVLWIGYLLYPWLSNFNDTISIGIHRKCIIIVCTIWIGAFESSALLVLSIPDRS